jgi:hypothetical protein
MAVVVRDIRGRFKLANKTMWLQAWGKLVNVCRLGEKFVQHSADFGL